MPTLSFSEIFIIIAVAVFVIKPKDLPMIIRNITIFFTSLKSTINQTKKSMQNIANDISNDSGLLDISKNIKDETNMILGDDGEYHESFDISDILHNKNIQDK